MVAVQWRSGLVLGNYLMMRSDGLGKNNQNNVQLVSGPEYKQYQIPGIGVPPKT